MNFKSQIIRFNFLLSLLLFSLFATELRSEPPENVRGTIGYFCQVRYVPNSGPLGDEGHILSILWSQENCGGSYVGHRYFCSKGASSSYCPSSSSYLYNENQILALFKAIQNHTISGNRVIVQGGENGYTCGHKFCGAVVDFYGN